MVCRVYGDHNLAMVCRVYGDHVAKSVAGQKANIISEVPVPLSFFFFLLLLLLLFLIQFNVPFKIISAHMRRYQSVGGAKTGEPREKPPDTPASRTWLVSHVARAGLEPTPDTAVR